jgi:diguanylate cyclase (GGDEF)-like protein
MLVTSPARPSKHDAGAMSATPRIDLSAFTDSRFAQQLRDGFWSLRFPKDLERQFQDFHLQRSRARVRVFFVLWPIMEVYRLIDGLLTGFNDTLGHQAGDACLQRIASVMKTYARRPLDMAARYGGEEFAIILFQTPPDQVRAIAEAVRATVESLGIENPAAPRRFVTVSCGVAVVTPVQGRSVHGVVQLADEALYEAKGSGRNCVRSADSEYASMATGVFRQRNHLRIVS